MIKELDILLKENTGCGIFLFSTEDEIDSVIKHIESNTGDDTVILISAEEIGVIDIEDFFKKRLSQFGVSSLKELAEKNLKERKRLILIVKDIEHLSFEQLKSFERICKEARSLYSVFLIGKEKVRSLIDSFYLKDLRKNAIVLYGCGILKKEDIKDFAEKYFKSFLGKDISIETGVETLLYKISEGNEKKLEQLLQRLSGYIKDKTLTKEIIKTYLNDRGINIPEYSDIKKKKSKENININPKIIAGSAFVFFLFLGILVFMLGRGNEDGKITGVNGQVKSSPAEEIAGVETPEKGNDETSKGETINITQSDNDNIKKEETQNEKISTVKRYFPVQKRVFLRENPDSSSKKIALVTNKQLLELLEEKKDWLKVRVKKGDKVIEGWINRKQVVVVPEGRGVIFARALNLREHPSLNAKIIKSIPYGTVVDIKNELRVGNKTWYKVEYIDPDGNIYEGWVSGKFVLYNKGKEG